MSGPEIAGRLYWQITANCEKLTGPRWATVIVLMFFGAMIQAAGFYAVIAIERMPPNWWPRVRRRALDAWGFTGRLR